MIMLRNRIVWMGMALWTAAAIAAFALRDYPELMFEAVNAMIISASFGVCVAFYTAVRKILATDRSDLSGGHFLMLGIFTLAAATCLETIWRWIWRATEQHSMLNHPLLAWAMFVGATGFALHLVARDAIHGEIPTTAWLQLGSAAAFALLVFLIAVVFIVLR